MAIITNECITGDEFVYASFEEIKHHIDLWNVNEAGVDFYDGLFLVDRLDDGYEAVVFGAQACFTYFASVVSQLTNSWAQDMHKYIHDSSTARDTIMQCEWLVNERSLLNEAQVVCAFDIGPRTLIVFKKH